MTAQPHEIVRQRTISYMAEISASVARQTLPAQLDRVEKGEEISITRYGRVVAVLVRPDALAARRSSRVWAGADRIGSMLDQARDEPLEGAVMSAERAEELVDDIRAGRAVR